MEQIPLSIRLHDRATLRNFVPGANQAVVNYLSAFMIENKDWFAYIYGASGTGRTHLLQALCHLAAENELQSIYLPLKEMFEMTPSVLENVESYSLIVLDDIDLIPNSTVWQEAIFHLYNRIQVLGHKLIVSAKQSPLNINLALKDLKSRLSAGTIFQLQALTDSEKIQALQYRATLRGLKLPEEVADYLLKYWPRDLGTLFSALEKLDIASLAAKRKLTIPFVKKALNL